MYVAGAVVEGSQGKNKGWASGRFGLGQILHPASDMNDVRFVESAVKHLTERRQQRCSDRSEGCSVFGVPGGGGRNRGPGGIDEVLGRLLRWWPARIIHSIESGPKTLHTLLQITEALINSARRGGRKFMGNVKLECIPSWPGQEHRSLRMRGSTLSTLLNGPGESGKWFCLAFFSFLTFFIN